MDDLYLDNIDEFVNDHNKIVTYKWLSLTLGVHVNLAKKMLYHYLEQKRRDSSAQLHATYLVSGKLVENGHTCHKVSVVREDQLEDVKSKMSLTVSVHVYSVQKAVLKDSGPLYSVDYDAVKENMKNCSRYSAIRCASAIRRPSAEVQEAPETRLAPPPDAECLKPGMNGPAGLPGKSASKQPKGIMGMFADNKRASKNAESEKEVKSEEKEERPVAESSKGKPAVKTNAMTNFFGKQAAKKPDKTVKEENEAQPSPSVEERPSSPAANISETERSLSPAAIVSETERDVKQEQCKEAEVDKDIRSKTKRLDLSDEEEEEKMESQRRKRRRIKKPQPESSDEESEMSWTVVPESPHGEAVRRPSPSPEREVKKEPICHPDEHSECKRRKRRRVMKTRTFMDEEGCIVTEKVYESESYSETEDEVQASEPIPKGPAPAKLATGKKDKEERKNQKKASPAAKKATKQGSIMGFFQKK